jgi:hypothetical protein
MRMGTSTTLPENLAVNQRTSTISRSRRDIDERTVTAMTALLVFVVVLAALGAASLLGWTVDSTDPDFALGRLIGHHPRAADAASSPAQPVISAGELRP